MHPAFRRTWTLIRSPDFKHYLATEGTESFFVKNLETIQGDDRDAIFLSVGSGFDGLCRMSMNFGTLTT